MNKKNLHTIKSTGFKIPDNYFEMVEDSIFSKLHNMKSSCEFDSTGFKVPPCYFESFDDKILNLVHTESKTKVIPFKNWKKVAYISGIAASLIIAFNVFFNNSTQIKFDNLETASIENYLLNEDLTAYDFEPFLNVSDLNTDNFVENHLNASDIKDYLLQNSDIEYLITD